MPVKSPQQPRDGHQRPTKRIRRHTPQRKKRTPYVSPEGFAVNENGVCTNPEKVVVHETKHQHIIISLAQVNGAWWWGMDCRADWSRNSAVGGPCSSVKKMYGTERRHGNTRDEALRCAVGKAVKWFKYAETQRYRQTGFEPERAYADAAKHCPAQLKLL